MSLGFLLLVQWLSRGTGSFHGRVEMIDSFIERFKFAIQKAILSIRAQVS